MLSENVSNEYRWMLEEVEDWRQVTCKDDNFELQMKG